MPKIFTAFLIVSLILICRPNLVLAQAVQPKRVLFINQVRGTECCDAGSTFHLQKQIDEFTATKLAATFTIRYDALIDPEFETIFQKLDNEQFELGILLEVTPQLAKDSGVEYRGKLEDWYQAQQVYTIGYSESDRKKLIDTLFAQFHDVFNYYPQTTTGWIVDTNSMNYMKEIYGVSIHQLTREQWGTDSYTLYGGPFHYPYVASKNWAMIPGDCKSEQQCTENSTLIVRQTVSDPLRNYGDQNSAFTSQPNDYSRDGKDFSYFEKLLTQTLNQNQNPYSVAVLGLENSMDLSFQTEYLKQIRWIADYSNEKPEMKALKASDFRQEYLEKWSSNVISSVVGKNLIDDESVQAVWITTSTYRVRLLQKDGEVKITDIRVYDKDLNDPYNSYVAQHLGYWVLPFLIDGSRFHTFVDETDTSKSFWQIANDSISKTLFPPRDLPSAFFSSWKSDFYEQSHPASINLPTSTSDWLIRSIQHDKSAIELQYHSDKTASVLILFYEDHFLIRSPQISSVLNLNNATNIAETPFIQSRETSETEKQLVWLKEDQKGNYFEMTVRCKSQDECILTPSILDSIDWPQISSVYSPYFFPENVLPADIEKTIFTVENQYSIAGETPAHLIFIPRDKYGYSAIDFTEPEVISVPPLNDYFVNKTDSGRKILIDAVENKIGKYEIEIKYGGINQKQTIYFAPNCSEDFWYCIKHPLQTSWYIKSKIDLYVENGVEKN